MPNDRVRVWVQVFRDRPSLVLQWFDPETGARRSKSAKTADPEEAEQARADLEYELNHGLHSEPNKLTWSKFRQIFEAEYLPGLRPRSREKFGTVFDVFEAEAKPDKLCTINERTISRFVQGLRVRKQRSGKVGLAPFTIRNYLVTISTALNYAADQRLIDACPKMPKVKVPKKKPQPIPAETFERLLEKEKDDHWRAFMCCGWWAGLRLSEAYALRWERSEEYPWIDWTADRIILPAAFAKSDEDQWVPLHPELRQMFEALPRTGAKVFPFRSSKGNHGPLSRTGVSWHVRQRAKQAGVRLSMHQLRKGFGCRVAQLLGKGNAPILHRLMRHSSMQITMDFYASVDDVLQDAIGKL